MVLYRLARPLVHALDAETAHRSTIAMLKIMPRLPLPTHPPAHRGRHPPP